MLTTSRSTWLPLESVNTVGAGWRPVSKYKGFPQDFCSLRCRAEVSGLGSQISYCLPHTPGESHSGCPAALPPSLYHLFLFPQQERDCFSPKSSQKSEREVSAWRSYTSTDQISGLFSIKFWLQHKRAWPLPVCQQHGCKAKGNFSPVSMAGLQPEKPLPLTLSP